MPGESIKTALESGKLMGELAANMKVPLRLIWGHIDIFYTIPLVGTPLYEYGIQVGLLGKTAEDEEEYLKITSNVAMYKRYFINLNGAPMSEVVFWDMLVFLEATRTFDKLMKNKALNPVWVKKFISILKIQSRNPHVKSKHKKIKKGISISNYFITNFLRKHVIFNRKISKIPRLLVDPIVRYMLYFEFLVQKNIFKDKNLLHSVSATNKKMNADIRLKYEYMDSSKTNRMDRSLRSVVKKKIMQLNRTEEEKTLDSLTGGP